MSVKKIRSLLEVGVFQSDPKPTKIISYLRSNHTVKMKDSYLGMILTKNTTITVYKFTFSCISGAKYCLICTFLYMQTDQIHIHMQTIRVSRVLLVNIILLFLGEPMLDKLKIWQRQILSRFLEGPNKFCQSSASGPFVLDRP